MSGTIARQRQGLARFRQGDYEGARRAFAKAAESAPGDPAIREALAETLARLHRWPEAEREARAALAMAPRSPSLNDLLARAALERADHAVALEHLSASLTARPTHAGTLVNLGVVLHRIGEWESAVTAGHAALRLEPGLLAARLGLSLSLHALGREREALDVLAAVKRHPMARFNEGFIRAHSGDLEQGLALMEARLELRDPGTGHGPRWQGDPVEGTLLVLPEQGLGDVLLMCGFLPSLAARARTVVVQAPPPLARLFTTCFPDLRIVSTLVDVKADAHVSMMSLAHLSGVRSHADFPVGPWLSMGTPLPRDRRPRVGINWAGNPRYAYDAIRSTSLGQLSPLFEETSVEWVSLHKGVREEEARAASLPTPLEAASDFLDTAEVIRGLDLVISTETAIPNLSAALGVPTIVLTHPAPDWRWIHGHAGITVAAQHSVGDWSNPIAIARTAVRSLATAQAAA